MYGRLTSSSATSSCSPSPNSGAHSNSPLRNWLEVAPLTVTAPPCMPPPVEESGKRSSTADKVAPSDRIASS